MLLLGANEPAVGIKESLLGGGQMPTEAFLSHRCDGWLKAGC